MANNYASVEDLALMIGADSAKYGVQLQNCLDTAAEQINNLTNRIEDGYLADTVASTREYVGNGTGVLRIDECIEITQVSVKASYTDTTYTNWTNADWIAFRGSFKHPVFGTPAVRNKPYTGIMVNKANGQFKFFTNGYTGSSWSGFVTDRYYDDLSDVYNPTVRVTARWGYSAVVPEVIKTCTLILATKLFKRSQAAFADAIGNSEFGELRYVDEIDKNVRSMLMKGRFMRPAI